MALDERLDPYLSNRFAIEIDGLVVGGFSEVSGLQVDVEVHEYREGGVNDHVHKLPKLAKPQNITLKRGLTHSDVLWKWHKNVISGNIKRKGGRIILLDEQGNEAWYWTFEDGYPIKWTGPELKAMDGSFAVETIEIVHNGLKKG